MAARMLLHLSRGFVLSPPCTVARYRSRATGPGAAFLKGKVVKILNSWFQDVEDLMMYSQSLRNWRLKVKNRGYNKIRQLHGNDFAAAAFALNLNGRIKLRGEKEWLSRSLADLEEDLCLEGMDISGSIINYTGLSNLESLRSLRYLDLSRCPYIDDWCLNRLYVLAGTLEVLSIASCHRVTEKGLACLHHLENLKRLDVSDLPEVPYQGLVRILLEEMLPQCHIVGMEMKPCDEIDADSHPVTPRGLEARTFTRS